MKKFLVFALVLFTAFSVFAGGEKEAAANDGTIKIALIVENTIDDKGWCQAMHDGILSAQQKMPGKIEYKPYEKTQVVDSSSIMRQAIAEGCNLIIAHGAQYKNTITETAEEYPDVSFAFGTSDAIVADNVFTYMPESEETGYLSGILAGMLTKVDEVGFVGPIDGGDAARYNRGFVLGVQAVNPDCKIHATHIGSFSDVVKSGEVATTLLKNGCDVITGSAQQALGALRATSEFPEALWLGQDLAQLTTAEGKAKCVAASSYAYDAVVIGMVEKIESGVKGGEVIPLNFNNGGFVFGWNDALKSVVTPEMEKAVNEALDSFKATPKTLAHYTSVDYSKL